MKLILECTHARGASAVISRDVIDRGITLLDILGLLGFRIPEQNPSNVIGPEPHPHLKSFPKASVKSQLSLIPVFGDWAKPGMQPLAAP